MASTNQYRRIKGAKARRFFGVEGLWEGEDHLLLVYDTGYSRSYTRFYYGDIQAFVVRLNRWRAVWTVITTMLTALAVGLIFYFSAPDAWNLSVPGVLLAAGGVNWLRGATCTTAVVTRVQEQRLPLRRLRLARRALSEIEARIAEVQGRLDPDREYTVTDTSRAKPAASSSGSKAVETIAYRGRIHAWLYVCLLLEGGISAYQLFVRYDPWWWPIDSVLSITLIILIALALARQRSSQFPASLRNTTRGALAVYLVASLMGMIHGGVIGFQHAKEGLSRFELMRLAIETGPDDSLLVRAGLWIGALVFTALGAFGLMQLRRFLKGRPAAL